MYIFEITDESQQQIIDYRFGDTSDITFVVLTSHGAMLFHSKKGNTLPWKQLSDLCHKQMDKEIQEDIFDICLKNNSYLLRRSRSLKDFLHGDRSQYSIDLDDFVKELLTRKMAQPNTTIWLGDPKQGEGELVGTIDKILNRKFPPAKLVLYHGTSTQRLASIEKRGLIPLAMKYRIWNDENDEDMTFNEDSIYLTAVLAQAEYYAKEAVDFDKKLYKKNVKPVIIKVTIDQSNYHLLRADDDYMVDNHDKQKTWMNSLSQYGQVSYKGKIPPQDLAIIAVGKKAEQHSQ